MRTPSEGHYSRKGQVEIVVSGQVRCDGCGRWAPGASVGRHAEIHLFRGI